MKRVTYMCQVEAYIDVPDDCMVEEGDMFSDREYCPANMEVDLESVLAIDDIEVTCVEYLDDETKAPKTKDVPNNSERS